MSHYRVEHLKKLQYYKLKSRLISIFQTITALYINSKSRMRKITSLLFALLFVAASTQAKEGMWLPYLIGQLNADEMTAMGLQISAEDIYSVNNSSIKDAIVHFGGGCTAELISSKGLLLTNHHCGYGKIQSHSSLEKNYLKDGFWAMSSEEELKNPGLTASIVKYMKDVTNQMLEGTTVDMDAAERKAIMDENASKIIAQNEDAYEKEIKAFFYGNQYILIAKEEFRDVRLVGAPPSSIGKYGADTDNWVWPRHTGDFSIFRIYAGADNKPADVSDDNVPYTPVQHLKINLSGAKKNDFTMVYGFPGTTNEYLPSNEIKYIIEDYDPARIAVRDELLAILDKKMRESEATRIQYASKYARISNAWKKWKGEVKGLKETKAVAKKEAMEASFEEAVNANAEWRQNYGTLLTDLKKLYEERKPIVLERYMFLETMYYGSELMKHLYGYRNLTALYDEENEEDLAKAAAKKAESLDGFYKDYDSELDEKAMQTLLPVYLASVKTEPVPEFIAKLKKMSAEDLDDFVEDMFEDLMVLQEREDWKEMLNENPEKAIKKLKKTDAMQLASASWAHFIETVNPKTNDWEDRIDALQGKYVGALREVFPMKRMYPDANSTLRISYGKVRGYEPADGVEYESHTYLSGVIAKYVPGDYEFDLPAKLIDLYKSKDYGKYAEGDKMPVCFIASNHTTGGNSGSPALNGKGELIGLNFDRTWEGTMSDYNYDIDRCRNIMVDIRYVLFIVDKFAGAGYLVDEMDIVTSVLETGVIDEESKVKGKEMPETAPAN